MHATKTAALVALTISVGDVAIADQRYSGAHLSFSLPAGVMAKEATDVVADYAVEVVIPPGSPAAGAHLRFLLSTAKYGDNDVEAGANAWRDARLNNRASWGVRSRGERRAEVGHIGARRTVRLIDQMGSMLGASRQTMVCASISSKMVCGVLDGPTETETPGLAIMTHAFETLSVVK